MAPRGKNDLDATAEAHDAVAAHLRALAREAKRNGDSLLHDIALRHARQAKNVAALYRKANSGL